MSTAESRRRTGAAAQAGPGHSRFLKELAARQNDPEGRTWIYVPYDQLSAQYPHWSQLDPRRVGLVFIENPEKASRRPYHKQKLAYVLGNGRRFLLEQAERGVAVDFRVARRGYGLELSAAAERHGPLLMAEPAEAELRRELAPLRARGLLRQVENEGFLTSAQEFHASQKRANGKNGPPWRQDAFYRHVRQKRGWLMDGDQPRGGRWSLDSENREPWRGSPPAPRILEFKSDPIKQEVGELIERHFAQHPGELHLERVPTHLQEAEAQWAWAKSQALPHFGPYEDAFSQAEPVLFHTLLSPLLNLGRLLPGPLIGEALALDLPLQCSEGFLRQVLGWREFMRHVHRETDGLQALPAGFKHNTLEARRDLPAAFWPGAPSGLNCLDGVVKDVWASGYSHHITRLMVLSNIAALLDVDPRQLTDWFWSAYIDAFDWVVEPNVLGMGTFSLGELFTTKPYISGAAYLHRQGDACGPCRFDPKKNCPLTALYWAYLERHQPQLATNPRLFIPLQAAAKRTAAQKAADQQQFQALGAALAAGLPSTPQTLAATNGPQGRAAQTGLFPPEDSSPGRGKR
jgi:deoxyribodipyrimidine photolyase-related protein